MDNDGTQEIMLENEVFDASGNLLWTCGTGGVGTFPQPVNVDSDDEGELLVAGFGRMTLCDDDGTQLWSRTYGSYGTAVCVADFDNDGVQEFGFAQSGNFYLIESDGTNRWVTPVNDSSGLAACAGYDFDGDGRYEVLFADQTSVWIFDGLTGRANYEHPDHASGTAWEFPTVADVDNDGSAEIVYVSNDYWMTGWNGVTVLGHAGDGWKKSGTTWNVHDFAVTNINPDGSVPVVPDPPWQVHNVYRARPSVDQPAGADLLVEITDVCLSDCEDGPIKVAIQVSNEGGADVAAGTPWALYKNDAGTLTFVRTGTLPAIAAGEALAGFEVELALAEFGTDGIVVRVDDDGAGGGDVVDECEETDNEATLVESFCE
jgi:hypothetical protein